LWTVAVLAVLVIASVVVVVSLGERLSFFNDDWWFLLQRPGLESGGGLDVLLAPHNSNLVIVPVIVYKAMVALFGLSHQLPYRLVLALAIAVLGLLVFALVERRAGRMWALAAAAVVVFLGPAWEDLLFFASIDLIFSLVFGLLALLALEEDSPGRNAAACVALALSIGSSNVGIAFAAGIGAAILIRRRPRQLWVTGVPAALFAVWWLTYGHDQPSHLSGANVTHLPRYLLDSAAAGTASITGLAQRTSYTHGYYMLVVVALLLVLWIARGGRPTQRVLPPLVVLLAFWVLTGLSFYTGREPFASRYQLIDVVVLILVVAALVQRPPRAKAWAVIPVGLATVVVAANVSVSLVDGYRFLRTQSGYVKADLGVLSALRSRVPPHLWLVASVTHNPYLAGITGNRYLAETAAHGEPSGFTSRQIAGASASQRQSADGVIVAIDGPTAVRVRSALGPRCSTVGAATSGRAPSMIVGPGAVSITNAGRQGVAVGVSRFAPPTVPTGISLLPPNASVRVDLPTDSVPAPWRVEPFTGGGTSGSIRVCRS
jgi:hypothetical protein